MSLHDLYLLSPELSVAGLAAILILVDLFVSRKGVLPVLALVGLAVPLGLSLVLWFDMDSEGVSSWPGAFDTFVVDRFSLFFKFLFVGVAAVIVLVSTEYVRKFERFQSEYYALILFSTSGMMLLASTTELISIYISLELTALPLVALAAFLRDSRSAESMTRYRVLPQVV